jgi:hypothetical protein
MDLLLVCFYFIRTYKSFLILAELLIVCNHKLVHILLVGVLTNWPENLDYTIAAPTTVKPQPVIFTKFLITLCDTRRGSLQPVFCQCENMILLLYL